MFVRISGFDLPLTAASGQSFRFVPVGDAFSLTAFGRHLFIRQKAADMFEFSCTQGEFDAIWHDYFSLDTDYAQINAMVPMDGSYLRRAVDYAGGMRILRQEPFETLISFIISQRRSIPSIRDCSERLSKRFGKCLADGVRDFPSPSSLSEAYPEEVASCGLGYRVPYVQQTARIIAQERLVLEDLNGLSDREIKDELLKLPGVGEKVASCVMLFAYHRLDAFPVDVWIDRVLKNEYPSGFPFERYAGVSGVLQQYMFCYARRQAELSRKGVSTCQRTVPSV